MRQLKSVWLFHALSALSLMLWGAVYSFGDCKAPSYRVGKIYENTAPSIMLNISLRPEDFAPERLTCLVGSLKQKYQAPEVVIGMFSSHKAAVNYKILAVELPKNGVLWASKQHAQYYYNKEKHEDYLLLIPDGLSPGINSLFNSRIDLPAAGKPSCNLEIRDRCLLEFDHIDLPTNQALGSVTLTGRIERSGNVTAVRIVVDTDSSGQNVALATFAQRNLKSWRFERRQQEDTIKVEYSLNQVKTPLEHGIRVQFMLPNSVRIEIGPMLMPHE